MSVKVVVDALGWSGVVLPGMCLFGKTVTVVVDVDEQVRERRQASHPGVEFDPDTLAVWEFPEAAGTFPPSPVRLVGVVTTVWRGSAVAGLRDAGRWRGFAASALWLPAPVADDDLLLEADYAGVWVAARTTTGGARLVQEGAVRASTARRTTLDRWVEEKCYQRVLALRGEPLRAGGAT